MFIARKISRAKWSQSADLGEGEISADAVTADLRTSRNTLSFWHCGAGNPEEIENAVLALAPAADRIDRVDVVWLQHEQLQEDGQTFERSPGRTPVAGAVHQHLDLRRLDVVRLQRVAHRVAEALEHDQYLRLTKTQVKRLLTSALEARRVDSDQLSRKIREELPW